VLTISGAGETCTITSNVHKCVSNADCTSDVCACNSGYTATSKLCVSGMY